MAEGSDEERTEDPTPRRLAEARSKGQMPRSRELNTFTMLMGSVVLIYAFSEVIWRQCVLMFKTYLHIERRDIFEDAAIIRRITTIALDAAALVLPLMAFTVVVAIASTVMIGGWGFSEDFLSFKFEKMNPVSGLARMVSLQTAVELLKSMLKVILIGLVTWGLYLHDQDEFMTLARMDMDLAASTMGAMLMNGLLVICASLAVIAAIDVPFQLWHFKHQLMMTRKEVMDEMRDSEGKPEVKQQIRRLQMEFANRRMMDAVPRADVVITNPTHYAVALSYDQDSMGAPRVVAKGVDLIAANIREVAAESRVPLLAAPPLARALYHSTKLDHEIPAGLYTAVAQVLAYIYQLKDVRYWGGTPPPPPKNFEIPDEFVQEE
ncbi:MAG: hypothetical protein RIQ52_1328 [Pseudomonadota bacterium]|jgi:flagellar biosynthetic protein FlhB